MSLQGSFQTIALPDVMALLSSSSKSGELRVVGGHTEGKLWIQEGQLVASAVGKARDHVDAVFELLRLSDGSFVFRDGIEAPEPGEPVAVQPIVARAAERLEEWRGIEAVIPSLEHRVQLVSELATPEITLSAAEWQLVIAVALAGTARGVVEELDVSYFEGCQGVKRLVDSGLVVIEPPRVRTGAADAGRGSRRGTTPNAGSPATDEMLGADAATNGAVRVPAPQPAAAQADLAAAADDDERPLVLQPSGITSLSALGELVGSVPAASTAGALVPEAAGSGAPVIEPVQVVRHDDGDDSDDGGGLATVRHLFLAPPEHNGETPGTFDWEAWKKAAAAAQESGSAAPIRSITSAPSVQAERAERTAPATAPAAAPASAADPTLAAAAAATARWSVPDPTLAGGAGPIAAGPAGSARTAEPAGPTSVPATSGPAPATSPTGQSAAPGATDTKAKPGEPETINRGLLLKFLSSVRS